MTAPRSDTPAGRALLDAWRGKQPERHAGVSGEAQKRALAHARTRDASEYGNDGRAQQSERQGPQTACYVHTPTGTRGVSLDAALSMIRGGRVRSLDIHVDETP